MSPHAPHDDCVDALSGAHKAIADTPKRYRAMSPARIMMDIRTYERRRYY